jgi:hypothetical protein
VTPEETSRSLPLNEHIILNAADRELIAKRHAHQHHIPKARHRFNLVISQRNQFTTVCACPGAAPRWKLRAIGIADEYLNLLHGLGSFSYGLRPQPKRPGHDNQGALQRLYTWGTTPHFTVTETGRDRLLITILPILTAPRFQGNAELDRCGHSELRLCIHSDLGVLAWESALPHCERLARHVGLPLMVVKRKQGELIDRVSPALAEQRPQVRQSGTLPAHHALVLTGDVVLPVTSRPASATAS